MPDNLPASLPALFALPDHEVISLDGPDASAFAQAQFANEVLLLSPGQWQWNAWLTPKGRVIALFALIKQEQDRLLMLLPDGNASELATSLQRFVFRRKLKVAARDDLHVSGAFTQPTLATNARIGTLGESIELDYGHADEPRSLYIGPLSVARTFDPLFVVRWQAFDLMHGLARLPAAQREQWTPQQLSLERLNAFSVKKGCYPGQEIVARTHFLGKAKRGIALFETDGAVEAGVDVSDGERVIGSIISASKGDRPLAMAVLPLDRPAASLHVGGAGLVEVALRNGLER